VPELGKPGSVGALGVQSPRATQRNPLFSEPLRRVVRGTRCYHGLMRYEIVVHELAIEELESIRSFDQRRILVEVREQLGDQPTVPTRRRKCLIDLTPSFEHELPVWELRVGEFRVFYDVSEEERRVHIRAVRRKEPRHRTEDVV
jgi:mRNA-degrading endonuclease RelE of RelBE toxin-antitoxin system